MHIQRIGSLNFRTCTTLWPKSFNELVIQFSFKIVCKNGDSCLKGSELFLDQRVMKNVLTISFRRICQPNLYGWCIICATHLRFTYMWAASLDGNSRCRHNPSVLFFACIFCEKWKLTREGSREKCISSRKYVVR